MGRISSAVRVAAHCLDELTDVRPGESVLVIADDSAMSESHAEVVDALLGLARDRGADADLVVMRDSAPHEHHLSEAAATAMQTADVVFGCTKTSTASVYRHETPSRLREEERIRGLSLVYRSFEGMTGPSVLETDNRANAERAERLMRRLEAGSTIRLTCERGSDVILDIDGSYVSRSGHAHEPGELGLMSIGEAYTGPKVGTATGVAFFDGPVWLPGSPWPSSPLRVEMEDGQVVDVSGDGRIVSRLDRLMDRYDNARNVAEFAFGVNPEADQEEINVWKQRLGTVHIAIGDGTSYGQDVESEIHVDFVMNSPTVAIDDETVLDDGTLLV
jgi:leucyl aminopeptidase (aminopeptidase T)